MNRTMGFGIAAGGVLTSLVAVPSPASAHDPFVGSAQGAVLISQNHSRIQVWNYGPDGIDFGAQFKISGNTLVRPLAPPDGETRSVVVGGGSIVAFRKCQYDPGSGAFGCSSWMGA
jgi:hypothetical protein